MTAPHISWHLPHKRIFDLGVWLRHCFRKAIAVVNFVIIVWLDVVLKKDFVCGFTLIRGSLAVYHLGG